MSLEEIKRGEEAERLMNHPMFKEALEGIKSGILDAMTRSAMGDDKTHNKLVMALQITSKIEGYFLEIMQTGELAKIQFERENVITRLKNAATKKRA